MATKEELQQTIGRLEAELEQLKSADTTRRKEISRVFGRYHDDTGGYLSIARSKTVMSWETILVEIGKYMGRDEYSEMRNKIRSLEDTLAEAQEQPHE